MGDSPTGTILNFIPFTSFIEPTFWYKLSEIKLDDDKLEEKPRTIHGFYSHNNSCKLFVNNNSFSSTPSSESYDYLSVGTLLNLNSLESFKAHDKTVLLNQHGQEILKMMETDEIFNNLKMLTKFFMLTYADLKKYHFYYWLSFPALAAPTYTLLSSQNITSVFSESELSSLFEEQKSLGIPNEIPYFGAELSNGKVKVYLLKDFLEKLKSEIISPESSFLVYSDPSNYETYPGWPLRNLLYLVNLKCPNLLVNKKLNVICLRNKSTRIIKTPNIVLKIQISKAAPNEKSSTDEVKFVGWEKNERGKFGPRFVNLRESMDPSKLAASSIDLNLKLMKWRLMPDLDLDVIKNVKCLLLGAGTLGCNVARALMGWGVNNITFVDNGEISYSNPARQSLYTFNDCGKKKAIVAAQMVAQINPSIKAEGVVMGIPMPGHTGIDSENSAALHKLIEEHDVTFLLTDSRESRWLPSVICASLNKLAITSALGFDTYLVLRHGVFGAAEDGEKTKLGCYFCNDVTAPGNSQTDRTLDQQCTVTRPGVSAIAGALAVELLVSVLQHSKKASVPSEENCCLGSIPHSIRGFLTHHQTILPSTPSFNQCTACSSKITSEYETNKENFLEEAFKSSKYLEDLTGLTLLYKQTEEAEADIWDFEAQDDD